MVGDQGLPDTYSSTSVGTDEEWQFLPLDTLTLMAGPIGLMVTQTTEINKNKNQITKAANWEKSVNSTHVCS